MRTERREFKAKISNASKQLLWTLAGCIFEIS